MSTTEFPAIEVKKVEWRVAGKTILNSCSLQVLNGECVGIIGHNGAGKTTLFQMIMGLKIPARGDVFLGGISSLDPRARIRAAFLPERPYLNVEQSFSEFLSLHCALAGIPASKKNEEISRVAGEVGLQEVLAQKMRTFSKGMLQKASLAQLSIGDPVLMILDEPMSGLDPGSRDVLRSMMQKWKSMGRTVLFSSHAIEDVEALADRVVELVAGEVRFDGSVQQWKEKK
jgi:ABC-type multidrug transport system ATPase subunit